MPTYEYRRPDGTTFEVVQSFSDDPLTKDPETGVAVERVLHAPAVHFKGKGFYNTDYGTRKRQRENAASADGSSSGSTGDSSSSDSSSDSSSKGDSAGESTLKGTSETKKGEPSSKPAAKSAEKSGDAPHSGTGKPVAAAK
jgi:putative FmdB family regulatory protein